MIALPCSAHVSSSLTCKTSSRIFERLVSDGASQTVLSVCSASKMTMICTAGAAAELANVDCIFHGHHGMDLIGALQVGATIRSATMQEIVFTTPGILPEEAWSPLAVLVKTPQLLEVKVIIARRFCLSLPPSLPPSLSLSLCLSVSASLFLTVRLRVSFSLTSSGWSCQNPDRSRIGN